MELERSHSRRENTVAVVEASVARPKLPTYQEGEDITIFLTRFGRIAQLLQVDESTYAMRLGCRLNLYYLVSSSNLGLDCKLLKEALLNGFKKTADGYMFDSGSTNIDEGENFQQYSTHLLQLFQFWLDGSKVGDGVPACSQGLNHFRPDECLFSSRVTVIFKRKATPLLEAEEWPSASNIYSIALSRGIQKTSTSVPFIARNTSGDAFQAEREV